MRSRHSHRPTGGPTRGAARRLHRRGAAVVAFAACVIALAGYASAAAEAAGAPSPRETHDAYFIAKFQNNVRGKALVESVVAQRALLELRREHPDWPSRHLVAEMVRIRETWRKKLDPAATALLTRNELAAVLLDSLTESPVGFLGPGLRDIYRELVGRKWEEEAGHLQAIYDAEKLGREWGNWGNTVTVTLGKFLESEDETLRGAWNTLFAPDVGSNLGDGTQHIIDSDPALKSLAGINKLIDATGAIRGDLATFRSEFKAEMGAVRGEVAEVRKRLVALDEKQQKILDWMEQEDARRAEEQAAKAAAARTQLKLDAARSSVYLLSTFIGFSDPKLAREVGTLGNAAIQVAESLNQWSEAMGKFGKAGDTIGQALSSTVMTGNIVGAIMSLLPLFVDTGPTPEQMILEEIGELRKQVGAMHREMSSRFDRIDAKLNAIHETIEQRFEQIKLELGRIQGGVTALQEGLMDVEASLDRFSGNLFELVSDQEGRKLWLEADRAIGYLDRTGLEMPYTPTYVDHESFFFKWATTFSFDSIAAGPSERSYKPEDIATELRNPLHEANLNYLAEVARQLGVPFTSARMPSPRQWALAAGFYGTLAFEWPAHAGRIQRSRFEQIELVGRELRSSLRAISTTDTAEGPRANRELFARLFAYYRTNAADLNDALQQIEDQYLNERFPAVPHGRSLRERGVDLFGAPDQSVALGQPETVDVCDVGSGDGGALSVPSNAQLHAMVPNALRVAQALDLGGVGYCYRASYVDSRTLPSGATSAKLQVELMTLYDGTPVTTVSRTGDYEFYCDISGDTCRKPGDEATLRWERGLKADFEAEASVTEDHSMVPQAAADVAADLRVRRSELYRRFVAAFGTLNDDVRRAAQRLTGAKALLEAFIGFGLPRALAHDEFMQALLYGGQRLLDEDAEKRLSGGYAAAIAAPPAGNLRVAQDATAKAGAKALEDIVGEYLDRIDRGTHEEGHTMIELALSHARVTRWFTYDAETVVPPCEPYPECTETKPPCEPYPECTETKPPCEPYPECTETRKRFDLRAAKWTDFAGTRFAADRHSIVWKAKTPRASEGTFQETLSLVAGRVKPVVLARASVTLRPGEGKTVRVRGTRAGRRYLKRQRGQKLAVTARLRVRYESGPVQERAFKHKVTLKVKRRPGASRPA